jgi:hypothetical protein
MDIFDLIVFYYHSIMASLFRNKQCLENFQKALKYNDFVKFQTTKDRNSMWMAMSVRDRSILIEYIIMCTIGVKHPHLEHCFYNIMHTEAEKKNLQSVFDIK